MPVEIERKFLVRNDGWKELADAGMRIRQGYLTSTSHHSTRIRILDEDRAFLTLKFPRSCLSPP